MNRQRALGYLLSFSVLILVWKLASIIVASPILPDPETTFRAFYETAQTGQFWSDFGSSAYRVLVSIALAWCLAFPLGVIIGYYQKMDRYLSPLIFLTYPIPKMVFLPVIILLLGLGDPSKIFLITIIVFFQILVATKDGVAGIDRKYIDSMRSMNASEVDILREAVIPAALPSSFTALRIVTGTAISVLFFVESFAGSSGLGYMIMNAWTWMEYTQIYVGILAMSLMGLALYESFTLMERMMCRWKFPPEQTDDKKNGPVITKMVAYGQMIKLSHSLFALPFGLAAVAILAKDHAITYEMVFWVVMAIIGARSAAMGFNRIADAAIDSKNPRTKGRHIPSGILSVKESVAFVALSSLVFIFSAAMLSTICLVLSIPVLAFLFAYSYTKRFTWGSHLVLGASIGLIPLGASVAITGWVTLDTAILSAALLTYIAGFDIIYSCQDQVFDRESRLHSIPERFGTRKALAVSSVLHVVSFACIASLYWTVPMSSSYLLFVAAIGILFIAEHLLVRPNDLSRLDVAFFNVNSVISLAVLAAVLCGVFL